jgi:hypothetical protein
MAVSSPLEALQHLEQLYQRGFRDAVTDAALLKVASSQRPAMKPLCVTWNEI